MKGVFVLQDLFAVSKSGAGGGAGWGDVSAAAATLSFSSSLPRQRFSPIAHVHSENKAPRNTLSALGFEIRKPVTIPNDIAPSSMARNAEGNVEGDELQFDRKQLQQFSTSLSTFAKTGLISEKAGSQSALITLPFFNDLEAAVKALEDLADY